MRILDSHLHLWDPDALRYTWLDGPLARRFAETELPRIERASEEAAVFVQAETVEADFLAEVQWVAARADALGVLGIVAGVRLDRGVDTTVHLESLSAEPLVVGVRHLLQGEPDGTALSTAFVTGAREVAARDWTFDACVRAWQLPDVARLAGAIPELRIVLDHLGKPAVGTAEAPLPPSAEWVRDLAEVASHPLAYGKLSGLPAESGGSWSAAQLTPFLDVAADLFGADRLMWGSDWPVSAVARSVEYQSSARSRWADTVAAWAEDRGHDLDAVFHRTAAEAYRLPLS